MTCQTWVSWFKISQNFSHIDLWDCPSHHGRKSDLQMTSSRAPELWSAGKYAFRQMSPETVSWALELFWGQKPALLHIRLPRRELEIASKGIGVKFYWRSLCFIACSTSVFCVIAVNSSHGYSWLSYFIFSRNGVKKKINRISRWSSFVQT